VVLEILNHVVQYTTWRDGVQWGAERPLRCRQIRRDAPVQPGR
jgi:hypothetical protein